ncbi:MAG: hypothetical protein OXC48_09605, partial [Endozoicomonadaceae bacterium]|nr:hypothetical protein [Endozoicomonadaceae bacterium]
MVKIVGSGHHNDTFVKRAYTKIKEICQDYFFRAVSKVKNSFRRISDRDSFLVKLPDKEIGNRKAMNTEDFGCFSVFGSRETVILGINEKKARHVTNEYEAALGILDNLGAESDLIAEYEQKAEQAKQYLTALTSPKQRPTANQYRQILQLQEHCEQDVRKVKELLVKHAYDLWDQIDNMVNIAKQYSCTTRMNGMFTELKNASNIMSA